MKYYISSYNNYFSPLTFSLYSSKAGIKYLLAVSSSIKSKISAGLPF